MAQTLPELMRQHAEHAGDETAIVFQDQEHDYEITYADLARRAAVFCDALAREGVQPGDPVIILLNHRPELIYAFFGAVFHGAVPAIMPFLTEKLSPQRYREALASLVEITTPSAVITYRDFEAEIGSLQEGRASPQTVLYVEDQPVSIDWDWGMAKGLRRRAEDLVLLQHSSGTTGLQKGVALSHAAVLNQLDAYQSALELNPHDVIVSWLPLYHDMGLIAGFILPVLLKIKLVLMSPFDWVRAPYRLMGSISRYKGTLCWLPNFAYNFCARKIRDSDLEGVELSSLRAVINCSEPMRWESHQLFLERFESYGLDPAALATCYAMAENVFAVTQGGIEGPVVVDEVSRSSLSEHKFADPAEAGEESVRMLSAGSAISNTEIRVIDQNGDILPDRAIGEIALRGDSLLTEYYRRPDLTEKAFLDGWYLTGDLGYIVDGDLFITGRAKELIIVGGKNIYPQDLESLVYKVPGVYPGRAVAFGVFNDNLGTEDVAILAEIDLSVERTPVELERAIREVIASGSDVTARYIKVVERGWLIKTSSGKNARGANREKYLAEQGS